MPYVFGRTTPYQSDFRSIHQLCDQFGHPEPEEAYGRTFAFLTECPSTKKVDVNQVVQHGQSGVSDLSEKQILDISVEQLGLLVWKSRCKMGHVAGIVQTLGHKPETRQKLIALIDQIDWQRKYHSHHGKEVCPKLMGIAYGLNQLSPEEAGETLLVLLERAEFDHLEDPFIDEILKHIRPELVKTLINQDINSGVSLKLKPLLAWFLTSRSDQELSAFLSQIQPDRAAQEALGNALYQLLPRDASVLLPFLRNHVHELGPHVHCTLAPSPVEKLFQPAVDYWRERLKTHTPAQPYESLPPEVRVAFLLTEVHKAVLSQHRRDGIGDGKKMTTAIEFFKTQLPKQIEDAHVHMSEQIGQFTAQLEASDSTTDMPMSQSMIAAIDSFWDQLAHIEIRPEPHAKNLVTRLEIELLDRVEQAHVDINKAIESFPKQGRSELLKKVKKAQSDIETAIRSFKNHLKSIDAPPNMHIGHWIEERQHLLNTETSKEMKKLFDDAHFAQLSTEFEIERYYNETPNRQGEPVAYHCPRDYNNEKDLPLLQRRTESLVRVQDLVSSGKDLLAPENFDKGRDALMHLSWYSPEFLDNSSPGDRHYLEDLSTRIDLSALRKLPSLDALITQLDNLPRNTPEHALVQVQLLIVALKSAKQSRDYLASLQEKLTNHLFRLEGRSVENVSPEFLAHFQPILELPLVNGLVPALGALKKLRDRSLDEQQEELTAALHAYSSWFRIVGTFQVHAMPPFSMDDLTSFKEDTLEQIIKRTESAIQLEKKRMELALGDLNSLLTTDSHTGLKGEALGLYSELCVEEGSPTAFNDLLTILRYRLKDKLSSHPNDFTQVMTKKMDWDWEDELSSLLADKFRITTNDIQSLGLDSWQALEMAVKSQYQSEPELDKAYRSFCEKLSKQDSSLTKKEFIVQVFNKKQQTKP